jgi:hypothetical protein
MTFIRVYVNGRGVDAPEGSSALDAVRVADPALADRIAAGEKALTDSRGLPVSPQTPVQLGAIFRVVSNRGADAPPA